MFSKKKDFMEIIKERLLTVERNQVFDKFVRVPDERVEEAREYYLEVFDKFKEELENKEFETIKEMVKEYLTTFRKFVEHVNFVFNSKLEDSVEIARELLGAAEDFESFDSAVREYIEAKEEALLGESTEETESAEAY